MLFHNSRDPLYRSPFGAAPCGAAVTLRARADDYSRVILRIWWDGREIKRDMTRVAEDLYETTVAMPESPGLFWYYFMAESGGRTDYLGNAEDRLGGIGEMRASEPPSYQITVYSPDFKTPEWMRDGIMYQIMPDRFFEAKNRLEKSLAPGGYYHADWSEAPDLAITCDADNAARDFFGGDLQGIRKKLKYLKDLGVTAIYMNPVFRARSNHKYDTGDFEEIDPGFGTEEDFLALARAARRMGIRLVLDGVFSHVGSSSRYFNKDREYPEPGAYQSRESKYYPWFTFEEYPDKYDCWWGFKSLPNVRECEKSYSDYIINGENAIAARWLEAGASGWRLDVADELPMPFIRMLRARVKKKRNSCLIGEVWEDPSNKFAYGEIRSYCLGDTLDSCMNYTLRDTLISFMTRDIDAHQAVRRMEALRENLPRAFYYSMMNLLGSHDKPRIISLLAEAGEMSPIREKRRPTHLTDEQYALGKKRFIALFRFLCALPGMPCLYYADEAGATGMDDPYNRGTYPWGREDAELMSEIREIILSRKRSQALRTGSARLFAVNADVICALREIDAIDAFGAKHPSQRALCCLNRGMEALDIELFGSRARVPGMSALLVEGEKTQDE